MTTKIVTVSTADWVLVSSSQVGMMENTSGNACIYRAETSKPLASMKDGHYLEQYEKETWQFSNMESVYAIAIYSDAKLAVTEG